MPVAEWAVWVRCVVEVAGRPDLFVGRSGLARMLIEGRSRVSPDLRKPVKVFDFFSGCGGSSAGLRAAGFEIVFGLDNDLDAGRTFRANFAEAEFTYADIEDMPAESLDGIVGRWADHPLLFNACAPCQLFSRQRRGEAALGDSRLALLNHLLRFVRRHRPELIFVENVPGLRDGRAGREVFLGFTGVLQELGYKTSQGVVRSQDYGVPQRRARLVLLASLLGSVGLPAKTHGPGTQRPEYSTVAEWIADLPEIAAGTTHPLVPNHRAAGLTPLNLQRIRATPPGGGWQDLPRHLRPESRRSGFTGFHRRLRPFKVELPSACVDNSVHQLLERALRSSAPRSGYQRARGGLPPDLPSRLRLCR